MLVCDSIAWHSMQARGDAGAERAARQAAGVGGRVGAAGAQDRSKRPILYYSIVMIY